MVRRASPGAAGRRRRPRSAQPVAQASATALLTVAILGLLILLVGPARPRRDAQPRRPRSVNDGDSITLGAERIRLRGIDAPEFDQTCRRNGADYPCGRRAREALVRADRRRPVACSGWERDRYGRLLAACTAGGRDLNRSQVEAGWAVAYGDYEAEEDAARRKRRGALGRLVRPPARLARRAWRHGRERARRAWPASSTGCARCFDFSDRRPMSVVGDVEDA